MRRPNLISIASIDYVRRWTFNFENPFRLIFYYKMNDTTENNEPTEYFSWYSISWATYHTAHPGQLSVSITSFHSIPLRRINKEGFLTTIFIASYFSLLFWDTETPHSGRFAHIATVSISKRQSSPSFLTLWYLFKAFA